MSHTSRRSFLKYSLGLTLGGAITSVASTVATINILRHSRHSAYQQALDELLDENLFEPVPSDDVLNQMAKRLVKVDEYGIPLGFYFLAPLPIDPDTDKYIVTYRDELSQNPDFAHFKSEVYEQLHIMFLEGMETYWGKHFQFQEVDDSALSNLSLRLAAMESSINMGTRVNKSYSFSDEHIHPIGIIEANVENELLFDLSSPDSLAYLPLIFAHEFGHVVGLDHTETAAKNLSGDPWIIEKLTKIAVMSASSLNHIDGLNAAERVAYGMLKDFTQRACEKAESLCHVMAQNRSR